MTRMQFLRLFRKYALAVGVSPDLAHPHILRHSLCSTMAAEHADVYAIQQRAGHKNISSLKLGRLSCFVTFSPCGQRLC